ncbi:hypothetical protein TNCV_3302051 [Trichonephila clavipes]|nr:hypothetical protein TNCV_3302051 [Trichonephila clavipes]
MFANLYQNLCEYGPLRGNRHSEGGEAFQRDTVSNTFCFMHGTKCVGYRSKESKYHVGSSSYSRPALVTTITS